MGYGVGIANGYGIDWSSSPGRGKIFFLSASSRRSLGYPLPYPMIVGDLDPGVEGPKREADNLPPSSDEINNTRIYTSTVPYVFMAQFLINKTPWPESASELYRPSDRRLLAKLVPTFATWSA
jgi:hypothetical protein